jgi:septum site-determining protein MinC
VSAVGPMRLQGRSFIAFALAPKPPVLQWLAELDDWTRNSPGFFVGRPVILDLTSIESGHADIEHLISELQMRDIRIMAIEGTEPGKLGPKMPPLLKSGRPAGIDGSRYSGRREPLKGEQPEANSLLIEGPVRSGRSIVFPNGDVTVVGSIASGAEVVAGASIHVYGAIRGRALAGANGNSKARIFCSRAEPELLAIDGVYRTAEQMDPSLQGRAIQVWLERDELRLTAVE